MAYPALEVGQPGNPACPNEYNEASTLVCPGSKRLLLQVTGQAIQLQLGFMAQGMGGHAGGVVWQQPKPFLPVVASLARQFDAVRVKNYTAGAAAQVLISVEDE